MPISQHGRQTVALDTLGQQHGPGARKGIVEDAPFVAHRGETGPDLLDQIAIEVRHARRRLLAFRGNRDATAQRSEEHTSELQSLMRISYAVFCLKQKKNPHDKTKTTAAP